MATKWFLAVLIVAAGIYGFTNRDFFLHAYETDREVQTVPDTPFDAINQRMQEREAVKVEKASNEYQVPNTRTVALPRATPSEPQEIEDLEVRGGRVSIRGEVRDEDGPVEEATVALERIVGERSGVITVLTNDEGRFNASNLHGGRYRVRAWRAPDLTMRGSIVQFVEDRESGVVEIDLGLADESDSRFVVGFDGADAVVGRTSTISVSFRNTKVNDLGIIEDSPVPNQLARIELQGPLLLDGNVVATSGGNGIAQFSVKCTRVGQGRAVVIARNERKAVSVPACKLPPPPPATQVSVGSSFGQPSEQVVPAGTYEPGAIPPPAPLPRPGAKERARTGESLAPPPQPVVDPNNAQNSGQCRLDYQTWDRVAWGPVETHFGGGRVTFATVARIRNTGPLFCQYVRVS